MEKFFVGEDIENLMDFSLYIKENGVTVNQSVKVFESLGSRAWKQYSGTGHRTFSWEIYIIVCPFTINFVKNNFGKEVFFKWLPDGEKPGGEEVSGSVTISEIIRPRGNENEVDGKRVYKLIGLPVSDLSIEVLPENIENRRIT